MKEDDFSRKIMEFSVLIGAIPFPEFVIYY